MPLKPFINFSVVHTPRVGYNSKISQNEIASQLSREAILQLPVQISQKAYHGTDVPLYKKNFPLSALLSPASRANIPPALSSTSTVAPGPPESVLT